jgi:aspartyl/asparaginyl beta-hydroxylase (cupin superfamily)
MSVWKQPAMKEVRRIGITVLILALALYFVPIVALLFIVCGVIDVSRHKKLNRELLEKYFAGNGMLTWLLSPLNLLVDLLSYCNIHVYRLQDLPPAHRAEIETCVREFRENGPAIKAHVAKALGKSRRGMLTFKWFDSPQPIDLKIPGFERRYRYIKTIAISVFNTRERTSRHFGPLRLTFRVLYNLEPIDSREVFIEVDSKNYYWADEPLFIFDDTIFHRSVNDVDQVRYCLFMDIIRPNHAEALFGLAARGAGAVASSFKRLFYKHWSFIR